MLPPMTTRRDLLALSLAGAAFGSLGLVSPARAQDVKVDQTELMKADGIADRVLGKADAPVTIVEYASMTCGHCANFHTRTLPHVKKTYVETGKVRIIFRHFLLNNLDAAVAMIARCAPDDKYFDALEVFFATQQSWIGEFQKKVQAKEDPVPVLRNLALQIGFTQESFTACLTNQALLDGLNAARKRGETLFKVESTPTFFVNGTMYRGDMSVEEVDKILQPLVKG